MFEPIAVRVRITGKVKWRQSSDLRNAVLWYVEVDNVDVLETARLSPDQVAPYLESLYGGRSTNDSQQRGSVWPWFGQ